MSSAARSPPELTGTPAASGATATSASPATNRTLAGRLGGGFTAFQVRNYRIFYVGQSISLTGTWMQSLAQSWVVLTLTSSPILLGLATMLQFTPTLLLGLVGGVVADRYPKRRILIATQAASSLLALVLAGLVFTDHVRLWQVYTLALLLGVVNSFDMPARQSFVPEMVGKEHLLNAVALNSALFNAARIIGPAIAGVVLAAFGPAWCFLANGLTYWAVLVSLGVMRESELIGHGGRKARTAVRDGLRFVRETRPVLLTIVMIGVLSAFGLNFTIWMPLLARNDFDIGAGGFGLLMSAIGVGSFIGAMGLAFRRQAPSIIVISRLALLLGLAELTVGYLSHIPVSLHIALVMLPALGFSMTTAAALCNSNIQTQSPDHLRGRVMSIYLTVFTGSTPLGALLAGATSEHFGAPRSMIISGAVVLAGALVIGYLARAASSEPAVA